MSKKKSFLHNGEALLYSEDCYGGRLYSTYSLIAKNRFRWKNLPEEIEGHHIEEFLYNGGQVAFFKKDKMGYMCLPCSSNGNLNVYGDPLGFNVVGIGFNDTMSSKDIVRIKGNDDCFPTRLSVGYYTEWIDDIERTMKRNLRQLRQPYIVGTDKDNELSMKNVVKQIEEGKEAIYVQSDKGYKGEVGVYVAQLGVQNQLETLQKNKNDIMYELLTFLGINNANTDKKERMITDEVNANNINILMNLDFEYKCRKQACEEINKKFGLDIDVELVIEELQDEFMTVEVPNSKKEEDGKEVE